MIEYLKKELERLRGQSFPLEEEQENQWGYIYNKQKLPYGEILHVLIAYDTNKIDFLELICCYSDKRICCFLKFDNGGNDLPEETLFKISKSLEALGFSICTEEKYEEYWGKNNEISSNDKE